MRSKVYFSFLLFLIACSSISLVNAQPGIYSESDIELQSLFMDAQIEKHKGNFEKQIELLKEVIRRDKSSHAAQYEIARAFISQKNYEQAIKHASEATKLESNNQWYLLLLAEAYELSKSYSNAAAQYNKIISIEPGNPVSYHKLSLNQLRAGNVNDAIATLESLQARNGIEEETSRRLFDIYDKSGKVKEATTTLRELSNNFPGNTRLMNNLAAYLTENGDEAEGQKIYQKILEIEPDNAAANLSITRTAKGNNEAGDYLMSLMPVMENMDIPLDTKIQELMPYVSNINPNSSQSLSQISETLLDLYPNEAKVLALRADILFYSGEQIQSEKLYAQAIKLNDKKYTLWDQWMINLWQNGNTKKLEEVSYDAIDYFPNQVDAFLFHAIALSTNNKQQEAQEYIDEAQFVSGTKAELLNITKCINAWITDNNLSKEDINKIKPTDYVNPVYLEIIGDLYKEVGDNKLSKDYWKLALDFGGNSQRINQKIGA